MAAGGTAGGIKAVFNRSFWLFFGLALTSGLICWWVRGADVFLESLVEDAELLTFLLPKVVAASIVAALMPLLIPQAVVARFLGESSGFRGVTLASAVGSVMPGGAMTSFPLVTALHASGSGIHVLIAFLTSWGVLGVQRILMWELPLMGPQFVLVRVLVSLPLPFIAAAISMAIMRHRPFPGTGSSSELKP